MTSELAAPFYVLFNTQTYTSHTNQKQTTELKLRKKKKCSIRGEQKILTAHTEFSLVLLLMLVLVLKSENVTYKYMCFMRCAHIVQWFFFSLLWISTVGQARAPTICYCLSKLIRCRYTRSFLHRNWQMRKKKKKYRNEKKVCKNK